MKLQNIMLGLGKGHVISLTQAPPYVEVTYLPVTTSISSFKYHHVEVALMKDDSYVNTCYWYHENVPYDPNMEDYYGKTIKCVTGAELPKVLDKANLYVAGMLKSQEEATKTLQKTINQSYT